MEKENKHRFWFDGLKVSSVGQTHFFIFVSLIVLFFSISKVNYCWGQTFSPATDQNNNDGKLSDDKWVWSILESDFPSSVREDNLPLLKACLKLDDQQIAEIKKLVEYDKEVNQIGKAESYAETQPGRGEIKSNLPPGEPVKQGAKVRKLLAAKDEDFREWVKEEGYITWNTKITPTSDNSQIDNVDQKFPFQNWDDVFKKKRSFKLDRETHEKIFRLRIEYDSIREGFKDSPAHHSVWVHLQKSEPYKERQLRRQDILKEIEMIMSRY